MLQKIGLDDLSIEGIIKFLEKDRFTLSTTLVYLIVLGIIRSVAESLIFEYPVFSLYIIAQHTAFNFPVLVMGGLILKIAIDEKLRKVYNVILMGFWVVITPPFIDRYIFGYSGVEMSSLYGYYAEGTTFISKISSIPPPAILLNPGISPGLRFMLFSLFLFSTVYVTFKTKLLEKLKKTVKGKDHKPFVRSLSSVIFGGFGIWMVVWFINASVPTVISLHEEGILVLDYLNFKPYNNYYIFLRHFGFNYNEIFPTPQTSNSISLAEGLVMQQRSLFLTMYFTVLTIISLFGTLWACKKKLLERIYAKLDLNVLFTFTLSGVLGSAFLHNIDSVTEISGRTADLNQVYHGWALDPFYVLHVPYLFYIALLGGIIGFLASLIKVLNSEDGLPKNIVLPLIKTFFLGGLVLAILMGPVKCTLIYLINLALIYVTFTKDVGQHQHLKSIFYGLSSFSTFFLGVYTPGIWKIRVWDIEGGAPILERYTTLNLNRNPEITGGMLLFASSLAFAIVLIFVFKYLMNKYSFDLPYTLFLVIPFILPAISLGRLDILLVTISLGIWSGILATPKKPDLPYKIFLIEMIYIILVFWNLIPDLGI